MNAKKLDAPMLAWLADRELERRFRRLVPIAEEKAYYAGGRPVASSCSQNLIEHVGVIGDRRRVSRKKAS